MRRAATGDGAAAAARRWAMRFGNGGKGGGEGEWLPVGLKLITG